MYVYTSPCTNVSVNKKVTTKINSFDIKYTFSAFLNFLDNKYKTKGKKLKIFSQLLEKYHLETMKQNYKNM